MEKNELFQRDKQKYCGDVVFQIITTCNTVVYSTSDGVEDLDMT